MAASAASGCFSGGEEEQLNENLLGGMKWAA